MEIKTFVGSEEQREEDRIVVTGMGIVSPLGNDLTTVSQALQAGTSGLAFDEAMAEANFASQVSGRCVEPDLEFLSKD